MVRIDVAGIGTRRVRIANLPSEVTDGILRTALSRYGEVKQIQEKRWSRPYRYPVGNGIRLAVIALVKHPSTEHWPGIQFWCLTRGNQ